ncbi:MAG: M48 family metallopeptidase, partial [Bacteroidota bacterium]
KTIYLSLFLLFFFSLSTSAQWLAFPPVPEDTLPAHFRFDPNELRAEIYADIPIDLREQLYPRSSLKFADQAGLDLQYLMESGYVYNEWPEMEEYLNTILKKITPPDLKNAPYLRAYLLKDGDYNAFMSPIGAMYIHVGLFAYMPNESTLAGILAHELAHYYQKHSIQSFVKNISGEFRPGFLLLNKGAASAFSVSNEMEADSLAASWLNQAGYSIEGLIESTRIIKRLEAQLLLRSFTEWELDRVTHPHPQERLEMLQRLSDQQDPENKAQNLTDPTLFQKNSYRARKEILKYLLQDFEYYQCIEQAFTFHLYQPTNPEYVYYLLEAIRRNCYLNPDLWSQRFIANRYYEIAPRRQGGIQKIKRVTDFLDTFDRTMLALPEKALDEIKASFYWKGEPRFRTYEDAYIFFSRVGEVLKAPECLLSNAILYSFNPEYQTTLLEKYLAYPTVKHRDYAEHLMAGTLQNALPEQRLTVLSTVLNVARQGTEDILIRDKKTTQSTSIDHIVTGIKAVRPAGEVVFLNDLQYTQQRAYSILKELEGLSLVPIVSKGSKVEFHKLDPRYWETMQQLEVNEIEFVLCSIFETQKKSGEKEDYQAVLDLSTDVFLQRTKVNRYVDIMVANIREIPDGVPKVVFYGGEDKLVYREPTEPQLIDLLQQKLVASDLRTRQLDQYLLEKTKE